MSLPEAWTPDQGGTHVPTGATSKMLCFGGGANCCLMFGYVLSALASTYLQNKSITIKSNYTSRN